MIWKLFLHHLIILLVLSSIYIILINNIRIKVNKELLSFGWLIYPDQEVLDRQTIPIFIDNPLHPVITHSLFDFIVFNNLITYVHIFSLQINRVHYPIFLVPKSQGQLVFPIFYIHKPIHFQMLILYPLDFQIPINSIVWQSVVYTYIKFLRITEYTDITVVLILYKLIVHYFHPFFVEVLIEYRISNNFCFVVLK